MKSLFMEAHLKGFIETTYSNLLWTDRSDVMLTRLAQHKYCVNIYMVQCF